MPWAANDAKGHTQLASTPRLQRMWMHVANGELQRTGNDALAIRAANAAVHREHAKARRVVRAMTGNMTGNG